MRFLPGSTPVSGVGFGVLAETSFQLLTVAFFLSSRERTEVRATLLFCNQRPEVSADY
jgi:hypothetical protein